MNQELALAALRLFTRLLEASKAFFELLRQSRNEGDEGKEARKRPRHLNK